jgi:hypothetical protein
VGGGGGVAMSVKTFVVCRVILPTIMKIKAETFNIIPSSIVGQLFRENVKGGFLKVYLPSQRRIPDLLFGPLERASETRY